MKIELTLRGSSIAALSRATKIPVNRLRSRIDGGKEFKLDELAAVASVLGTSVSDLLERVEVAA